MKTVSYQTKKEKCSRITNQKKLFRKSLFQQAAIVAAFDWDPALRALASDTLRHRKKKGFRPGCLAWMDCSDVSWRSETKNGKRHWRSLSDLSANLQVWVSQECINRRHGSDQEHQKAHYIKEGPKHKAQPSQSFLHNPCLGAQLVNITHPQSFIEAKEPVRQLLRAKVFRKHMGVKTLVSFRSPKKIC